MNKHIKRKIRKFFSPIRRIGLKNKNFSIISNNCWGGVVYDIFGLQYTSPTIGCYFFSEDYIKFLQNLKYYCSIPLIRITVEESKNKEYFKNECLIIGKLDDIEIVFLHYNSFEEAKEKWERRCKRINYNNILVKYSDQNNFKELDLVEFLKLKFKNKLFITANKENMKYVDLNKNVNYVYLDKFSNIGIAIDDIKPSFKVMKLKEIFNSMNIEENEYD